MASYALWERVTLESFFGSHWQATPIKWENHAFVVPRDSSGAMAPYVAVVMRSGSGQAVSLGSSLLARQPALLVVEVFVPERSDKFVALTYVDALLALWIPQDFADGTNIIRTRPAYPMMVGSVEGWFQVNVVVPYILDTPVVNH